MDTLFALKFQESLNTTSLTNILEKQQAINKLVTIDGKAIEFERVAEDLLQTCVLGHVNEVPWCMLFVDRAEQWFREA